MASPWSKTVEVPVRFDPEGIVKQLEILRTLCSQIGFALDTAILALTPPAQRDGCQCPMSADTGQKGRSPSCPIHGYQDDTPTAHRDGQAS